MNIVTIPGKTLYGIKITTDNASEMNPQTAKIGTAWQQFDQAVDVDYQAGERVYGVYFNYESDENGRFDVLAGIERATGSTIDSVTIQPGRYLVFSGHTEVADDGSRIKTVIELWGQIWEYFSDSQAEHQRAFKTDFEFYKDPTIIDIYISIQ